MTLEICFCWVASLHSCYLSILQLLQGIVQSHLCSMLGVSPGVAGVIDRIIICLQVQRHESCEVILHGRSEFEATNVTMKGRQRFEVPDGFRMLVTTGSAGTLKTSLQVLTDDPSWEWKYSMAEQGNVQLQMLEQSSIQRRRQAVHDAAALSYII